MPSKKQIRKAQKARSRIALTFAALDNGQIRPHEILDNVPSCLERLLVYDVLRRFPHLSRDGAEKVLTRSKVWPLTRMGNLTYEERKRISANLPPRVKAA